MTDVVDYPASDSAMIALLPITTDWCRQDLPHMTLVYAGPIAELKPSDFNEMGKDAASIAMMSNSLMLRVTGIDTFGDVDKVDVLKLEPNSQLLAMRRMVEDWNASEFPFSPHVTIGPTRPMGIDPINTPSYLAFDRIYVGWGDECLTFWLKR